MNLSKRIFSQKKNFNVIRRYPIVGGRRISNFLWATVLFLGGCGFLLTGISSLFNRNILVLMPKVEKLNLVATDQPFSSFLGLPFTAWHSQVTLDDRNMSFGLQSWSQDTVSSLKDIQQGILKNPITSGNTSISNKESILAFFPQGLVLSFYGFLAVCFSFHLLGNLFWKIGGGFNEFNGKEKYVRVFRWGRPGKNRRIDLKYTNEFIENIKVEFVPRPALFLHLKGEKNIPLTRIGEFIPLEELEAQAAELTSLLQIPLEIEN